MRTSNLLIRCLVYSVALCLLHPGIIEAADSTGKRTLRDCLRNYGDGMGCQIPRPGPYPYDCAYNGKGMPCSGYNDGRTIRWKDGIVTKLWFSRIATPKEKKTWLRAGLMRIAPSDSVRLYTDVRGGVWLLDEIPNGNLRWINQETRNEIFVPIRPTCHPPLMGQVGYCSLPANRRTR